MMRVYNNTSWRKPFQFIYLFILFITTCNSIINENNNNKYYNVVDFGAKGDGKTFDTIAIQRAVRAVAHEGSGTIIFPKNKIFLTGPFNLTSFCTLFIEENTTILGSFNKADYMRIPALPSYGQGKHGGPTRRISLIHGENLTNVIITGKNGTIDGNGAVWWDHKEKNDTAPHLIEFMYSFNIEVSHVTLINTPFWTVHPYICKGFLAHHVWIINPSNVTNTDGIDPDSTQDVLIHNVYINTGDDGIAIKSGWDEYGYDVVNISSRNITIRDSTITTPCAAISVGSEMSGGVADVYISNTYLYDTTAGVHIKSGRGRGGYVHNIFMEKLTMNNCFYGIMVDTDSDKTPDNTPGHHFNLSAIPDIRNISARNVNGKKSKVVAKLIGLKEDPMRDIKLENIHFNDDAIYECGNVSGTYTNTFPKPCDLLIPEEIYVREV